MNDVLVKELIPQVIAGNHKAFEEFYDLTKNHVYRTIYFLFENKIETDDIAQETYYQLFKSLKKFDNTRRFEPWLTAIIIKQVSDARRKKWRFKRIVEKVFSFYTPGPDPLIDITQNEEYVQILKEVEQLSPKLKEVVLLKYVHQLPQEEIAQILGVPIGTVKSRIGSALNKLRMDTHLEEFRIIKEVKGHGF